MSSTTGTGPQSHTNRLAREPSPYLRQHQHNPVDWYPWGAEALERARREDRPILLSVGYSACHWCHVMAHESFENPDIAALMNAHFVNVKVDREERPDLDQIYQGVVQLQRRGGGWPLTVFLTPDLRPFFGGTYYPPEDRFGLPGFPRLLVSLAEAWRSRRKDVELQADSFQEGLGQLASLGLEAPAASFQPKDIVQAAQALEQSVDSVNGGFGGAPKFPNPMNVALLLRGWRRGGGEPLRSAALLTLRKMAEGGIFDQLGGGFHRYSVDERWLVPHFEKMLYDNAQLLHLYAEAQQLSPSPLWRQVVSETVAYLQREMTSPEGAFYAAQDADSEGEEGKYFVWTPAEIDALLSPEHAELVKRRFHVTASGNFEHATTVLEVKEDVDSLAKSTGRSVEEVERLLGEGRCKLLGARLKRVAPGRDDKVLAGWNGLAIRGLALAARVFGRQDWAQLAARAADTVLEKMWKDGRLFRSYQEGEARIDGFLEDYGDLAAGLVALFQATFEPRYLIEAEALVNAAVARFWDEDKQAYLTAPRGQKDLLVASYAIHDNAAPSGASTLTEAQVGLAALTGSDAHLRQAMRYLEKMRDPALENPFAFGHLLLAADAALDGAAEVTLVGEEKARAELERVVNATYAPTVALLVATESARAAPILEKTLENRRPNGHAAAAFVCRNFACEPPVAEPEPLRRALTQPAARPM